ncbi:lantibiotic modifying enzyme [Pedobacter cryoconitis]|uniref:Lantibiotic modifying enzyme n=1 Tax=Pedobacter cryoconitis TaxID=188932 RepID=A0A7W9DJX7_9SPHI|nr:lanthionine synthetase C family protein [Pedobacter cryoconitis]MBB5621667.1 lantibiotic modifying enzyme [Pedobacter cryoconitis]
MKSLNPALKIIIPYFEATPKNKDLIADISLYSGSGGILLFQALLFKLTKKDKHERALEITLAHIIRLIGNPQTVLSSTFANGLAGIGWLFLFLKDLEILDPDTDIFFQDIDLYLSNALNEMCKRKNYDLLHGSMGIATYFLKREKPDQVKKVINFLYKECETENDEVKWSRFENVFNEDIYDLGFAHGIAGILHFLSKCEAQDIEREKCQQMISGGFNFYFNNLQKQNEIGSFYGNHFPRKDYPDKKTAHFSRIAWCYGDLGILYTLYKISKNSERTIFMEKIEAMLLETAKRRSFQQTRIEDAGICHGTSGAGIIYQILYEETKKEIFREESVYWLNESAKLIQEQKSNTSAQVNSISKSNSKELLEGMAGIGIALLSSEFQEYPDFKSLKAWRECLFLH